MNPFSVKSLHYEGGSTIKDLELFGCELAGILEHKPLFSEMLKYAHLVIMGG